MLTYASDIRRRTCAGVRCGDIWRPLAAPRYSLYLLSWYKSTNTDAAARTLQVCECLRLAVSIALTVLCAGAGVCVRVCVCVCEGGRVRASERAREDVALNLTEHTMSYSVYLLYWYKSTNTDAAAGAERTSLNLTASYDVCYVC